VFTSRQGKQNEAKGTNSKGCLKGGGGMVKRGAAGAVNKVENSQEGKKGKKKVSGGMSDGVGNARWVEGDLLPMAM